MLDREKDLKVYLLRDACLCMKVPNLLVLWFQIRISNWMDRQWWSTSEVPFPNLDLLWKIIYDREVWEPTLPTRFALVTPELSQVCITEAEPPPAPDYHRPSTTPDLAVASTPESTSNVFYHVSPPL